MNLFIKKAKVCFPTHKLHNKIIDLIIEDGKIKTIGNSLKRPTDYTEISSNNLHISPGWLDLKANFCEPGLEEKETLDTGIKAAQVGGFTGVCLTPETTPFSDNRSSIEFIKNRSKNSTVTLYPLGALSKGGRGDELAEMFDMHSSGAVAFSDGSKPIDNPKFQLLLLQYAQNFDGLVYSFPLNTNLAGKGNVNEGVTSTYLGLKGIPNIAEELSVARDLQILEYTGGKLHFSDISTKKSTYLIEEAKKKKLNVSASVAWYHLLFNDNVIEEFDSNYKVLPPIRSEEDRMGLIQSLETGGIDTITSNHQPQNIELKACEFEHAEYGINGIQVAFSALNTFSKELKLDTIVKCLGINPYKVLNLDIPQIEEGKTANLTLFDPTKKWTFEKTNNYSLSDNNPILGKELIGKIIGIINGENGFNTM